MGIEEVKVLLSQSLGDGRLSRGEKSTLKALLDDLRPTVREQEILFDHAFALAEDRSLPVSWLRDVIKTLRPPEGITVSGTRVAEAFFFPGSEDLDRLTALLSNCRQSLEVCVFTITNDLITRAVLAAHRRGARVRILTDDEKAGDRGSDIERLAAGGIEVRTDDSPALMHHKFAILDGGALLTGSFNWTRSAVTDNQENLLMTDDPILVSAYADEFERLWERFGDKARGKTGRAP